MTKKKTKPKLVGGLSQKDRQKMRDSAEKVIFNSFCRVTLFKETDGFRFVTWVSNGENEWGYQASGFIATPVFIHGLDAAVKDLIGKSVENAIKLYETERKKRDVH